LVSETVQEVTVWIYSINLWCGHLQISWCWCYSLPAEC